MGALTKMNAGEGNTLIIYIHLYEKLNVKRKKMIRKLSKEWEKILYHNQTLLPPNLA